MKRNRGAFLAATLALPLAGLALPASADCWTGSAVGAGFWQQPVQVGAPNVPELQLIADANAMFSRMTAEMNAIDAQLQGLAAVPLVPYQFAPIRSAAPFWVSATPGTGIVVTTVSDGTRTCSQTVTYNYQTDARRPIIKVSRSGNACGAMLPNGPSQVEVAQPIPRRPAPRVWNVEYRTAARSG